MRSCSQADLSPGQLLQPNSTGTRGRVRREGPANDERRRCQPAARLRRSGGAAPEGREDGPLRSHITSWWALPSARRTASSSAGGGWKGKTDTWIAPRASGKTRLRWPASVWDPRAHIPSAPRCRTWHSPSVRPRKLSPQPLQQVGAFLSAWLWLFELITRKKKRAKVSDLIEGRRLLLAGVEWQSFKNMARAIVQIWSVTRKTIPRTRSQPLDLTRSGLKPAPTGPGNSGGGLGACENASVEVRKCAQVLSVMVSKAYLVRGRRLWPSNLIWWMWVMVCKSGSYFHRLSECIWFSPSFFLRTSPK